MMTIHKHNPAEHSDPSVNALSYVMLIVGLPIRLILKATMPIPSIQSLKTLQSVGRIAALLALSGGIGAFAIVLISLLAGFTETVWPGATDTLGRYLAFAFVGSIGSLFGGLILISGLHEYLNDDPSDHSDD